MKKIIEIKNLNKSFKDIKAVQNLNFSVNEGELFAFLGVNGAGKSTTINIMCDQLSKDSGEVIINNHNLDNESHIIKNEIGVVFQNSVLDMPLTVYDNLQNRAGLYNMSSSIFKERLSYLSKLLKFEDLLKRPISKLSGGQRRRIDIARALIHNPKILILDEPTTGLDPQTRKLLWDVIFDLRKKQNMTVFLTTHYMEEAADADYVVIIDNGSVSGEGTPLELKNKYTNDYITLYNTNEEIVKSLGLKYTQIKDAFKISIPNTYEATKLITEYPDIFVDYEITKGKMDDVFLTITGKNLIGGIE